MSMPIERFSKWWVMRRENKRCHYCGKPASNDPDLRLGFDWFCSEEHVQDQIAANAI